MGYFKKRKQAFGYAWEGIKTLFREESHARVHAVAAVLVVAFGIWLEVSAMEWCLLALCIGMVLMAEGFNTAIEAVCDKVSPEWHPMIKKAKDVAAGAVLLLVICVVAAGLIIFIPKLCAIFS